MKPLIHLSELELKPFGHGEKFEAKIASFSHLIGSTGIGCMLTVVPAGKRAFPFHNHHAKHEMFLILEGEGEYRFGEKSYPIRAGHVLAAPCGGQETAHQIINTGDKELRYLGLSTNQGKAPELVEYPDSGKFLIFSGSEQGSPMNATFKHITNSENTLDYWDGEV